MGITCKPTQKRTLKRMLKKIDNQNAKEQHLLNLGKGKEKKEDKNS